MMSSYPAFGDLVAVGETVRLTYPPIGFPFSRTGTVIQHCPEKGGYLVRHTEPKPWWAFWRKPATVTLGWAYHEVEQVGFKVEE